MEKRQVTIKIQDDGTIDHKVNNKKDLALKRGEKLCIAIKPNGADIQPAAASYAVGQDEQIVLNAYKHE